MGKIFLDYGHGGRDPGALYRSRREADDNLRLGLILAEKLRKAGLEVFESRKGNSFISLEDRCRRANSQEIDFFISLHRNAFRPSMARGLETYIYPGGSRRGRELAGRIHSSLLGLGFEDRRIRERKLYVLRRTRAAAILLEIGFIDNEGDNKIFDNNLEIIGESISRAIISMF